MSAPGFDKCLERLKQLYTPTDAHDWVLARQPLLDGRTPAELLQAGRVDEVLRAIDQLADGVYL